jgi:hypothetical protein
VDKRTFIINWNKKFSKDLWYRRKYNIRFNSKEHRELSPLDIAIEYEEYMLIEHEKEKRLKYEERAKLYAEGKIVVKRENEEETKQFFESLDLDSFNNGRE